MYNVNKRCLKLTIGFGKRFFNYNFRFSSYDFFMYLLPHLSSLSVKNFKIFFFWRFRTHWQWKICFISVNYPLQNYVPFNNNADVTMCCLKLAIPDYCLKMCDGFSGIEHFSQKKICDQVYEAQRKQCFRSPKPPTPPPPVVIPPEDPQDGTNDFFLHVDGRDPNQFIEGGHGQKLPLANPYLTAQDYVFYPPENTVVISKIETGSGEQQSSNKFQNQKENSATFPSNSLLSFISTKSKFLNITISAFILPSFLFLINILINSKL